MLRTQSSQLSFYGNHIYDRVIPGDHFLKLLDRVADFSFVNELCQDAYTPDFGRPAYEPEMMFKILFLQFLYDISDRRVEEEVNFNLVHTLVLDQCQRGQGYPVALSEAHEQAVVTGADRENFWQLVESSLVDEHLPSPSSAKSQSKRTRWV